jgi:hypothetical protein
MAGKVYLKRRFAINMPFTKRSVIDSRRGSGIALGFSDLLIVLTANVAAGVNDLGDNNLPARERPARLGENK